jgi:uncharacterized protein (DUF1684 family)
MDHATNYQELLDYRRSVSNMYARVRGEAPDAPSDPAARSERFRAERDELFRRHPQSPLSEEEKGRFEGLDYLDYDPSLRFVLPVEYDVEPGTLEILLQDDGPLRLQRFGRVRFRVGEEDFSLSLFWVSGYGGGVLLPFKDRTSGAETYGGGRYLLDTIKHADLGAEGERLVIDFNFAYNPSCAYDARWHCPLAPPENILPVEIGAGEKLYGG